ncbi:MAG: hypothetical protein KGI50_07475 [Patescibacteria group bacterium]|nr:hypothetical protein [Patescibacteria group bacterium]
MLFLQSQAPGNGNRYYTTSEEMYFISHLGKWSQMGAKIGHAESVRRYAVGAKQRVNWDRVNDAAVFAFVDRVLAEIDKEKK